MVTEANRAAPGAEPSAVELSRTFQAPRETVFAAWLREAGPGCS
jgi:uncharacterized protein YndB with AHSA1/START domain